MAVEIEELVLGPFKEVIERGRDAAAYAETVSDDRSAAMAKAAGAVVREGERALRKLQPLWDSQVAKHGEMFRECMGRNEHLARGRRQVEDLLYDFEDFAELDTFQEARYTALQAATKALALDVLDSIKCLKMDGVPVGPPPRQSIFPPLPPPPPGFVLSPASPRNSAQKPRTARESNASCGPPLIPQRHFRRVTGLEHVGLMMPNALRRQSSIAKSSAATSTASVYSTDSPSQYSTSSRTLQPPDICEIPPPVADARSMLERRPSTPDVRGSDSILHPRTTAWVSDQRMAAAPGAQPTPGPPTRPVMGRESAMLVRNTAMAGSPAGRPRMTPISIDASLAKDGHLPLDQSPITASATSTERTSGFSQEISVSPASTPPPRLPALKLPILEVPDALERSSLLAARLRGNTSTGPLQLLQPAPETSAVMDAMSPSDLRGASLAEAGLSIGPHSSLYQMKGFCKGARVFRSDGHLRGVRKTHGYVAGASTSVGCCISCGYGHQYKEVELDISHSPKANFMGASVRFRIRFLYKSHLITHKMTEAYYGCLFCAQTGCTVREGDSTVFMTSDALLRHLARHPQPLPEVRGLTVLYGADHGHNDRLNDFDLHFPVPPPLLTVPGFGFDMTLPENVSFDDLLRLPVATATRHHIQRYGEKKLSRPEGLPEACLLPFFVGARILGVDMPSRWAGKWASGYHGGSWGVFPVKAIELEPPRQHEMPPLSQASPSTVPLRCGDGRHRPTAATGAADRRFSVKARWKFDPPATNRELWLPFDKGDTIRNLAWPGPSRQDGWCWSGTNGKGKTGIFPRAYVCSEAVREEQPDGAWKLTPSLRTRKVPVTKPVSGKTSTPSGLFHLGRKQRTTMQRWNPSLESLSTASGVVEILPASHWDRRTAGT